MRRIASTIVLFIFGINCTYSFRYYDEYTKGQPIVISERVGETIDAVEGEQFALFQQVDNFEAATFYEIDEGGYEVSMLAGGKEYVAINRDPRAVQILRYYVDNHAEIMESRQVFEKKWGVVGYDTLGIAITKNEIGAYTDPGGPVALGLGCGLLSVLGIGLVGFMIYMSNWELDLFSGEQDEDKTAWSNAVLPLGVGAAMGIATYLWMSDNSKNRALQMIKEGRSPMVVDSLEQDDVR
jgi:hypothetical protein